jgi:hypothetical protein
MAKIHLATANRLFKHTEPALWAQNGAQTSVLDLTRLYDLILQRMLEDLERQAMERVRKECPEWVNSYAILGPCDYLDIFRAKDIETASKVSTLIRTFRMDSLGNA